MRGVPCSFYLGSTYALTFTSQCIYIYMLYLYIYIYIYISSIQTWPAPFSVHSKPLRLGALPATQSISGRAMSEVGGEPFVALCCGAGNRISTRRIPCLSECVYILTHINMCIFIIIYIYIPNISKHIIYI